MGVWKVIERECSSAEHAMLSSRVADAEALLSQIPRTFPLYTRHDRVHAANVLKIMEQLLGEEGLAVLTGLEAALLVLAAYYHDVGMVATQEELDAVAADPAFAQYLNSRPDLRLHGFEPDGRPSIDLLENYIRWMHAERASLRINELPVGAFDWGRVPLDQILSQLARSHNEGPVKLMDLPTAFLGQADVRMCAVLLRLADILDFDNSRTPEVLYTHLRLDRPSSKREQVSHEEWKKHLNANGFEWPAGPRRDGFALHFGAGPEDPATEHHLRSFLDVIDREVGRTRGVLRTCSDRWRDLPLPGVVDRGGIQSRGYRFGDFRFSMDREALLHLFMGERLYMDRSVFLRELLQNAIDATRLRALERGLAPDDDQLCLEIDLWAADDGSEWVSFNDKGSGMDEDIILKYLLSVGTSYYRSAEFEVRARAGRLEQAIVPISRFGIGLLSCFMAGDRVEISTLRQHEDGRMGAPVRLSMGDVDDFFVLQSGTLAAAPMPARGHDDPGYRTNPGTTVAVRIRSDGANDLDSFNRKVRQVLFDPPMRIMVNGAPVDSVVTAFIESGMPASTTSIERTPAADKLRSSGAELDGKKVNSLTLDLTRFSCTPNLRGQVVLISVDLGSVDFPPDQLLDRLTTSYQLGLAARKVLGSMLRPSVTLGVGGRSKGNVTFQYKLSLPMSDRHAGEVVEGLGLGRRYAFEDGLKFGEDGVDPWLGLSQGELSQLVAEISTTDASDSRGLSFVLSGLTDEGDRLLQCLREQGWLERFSSFRHARGLPDVQVTLPLADLGLATLAAVIRQAPGWAGHNGIALPVNGSTQDHVFHGSWGDHTKSWAFIGYVSLADSMRPDLNVARTDILDFPFEIQASLRLAVRRACFAALDEAEAERAVAELRSYPAKRVKRDVIGRSLGELLDTDFTSSAEVGRVVSASREQWRAERLLVTAGRRVSIVDLEELVQSGPVTLDAEVNWGPGFHRDAESIVLRGLLQEGFDVVVDGGKLLATGARSDARDTMGPLPPLLLCPHAEPASFWGGSDLPLNQSHPLGQWIEQNIVDLARLDHARFSGLVTALVSLASASPWRAVKTAAEVDEQVLLIGRQVRQLPAPPAVAMPTRDMAGTAVPIVQGGFRDNALGRRGAL